MMKFYFTLICKDRKTRGGGVMFDFKSCKSDQILQSRASIGSTIPTVYCLGYIPPDSSHEYYQEF